MPVFRGHKKRAEFRPRQPDSSGIFLFLARPAFDRHCVVGRLCTFLASVPALSGKCVAKPRLLWPWEGPVQQVCAGRRCPTVRLTQLPVCCNHHDGQSGPAGSLKRGLPFRCKGTAVNEVHTVSVEPEILWFGPWGVSKNAFLCWGNLFFPRFRKLPSGSCCVLCKAAIALLLSYF